MTPTLAVALANRYRIDRELGQGGMATVWLAEDLKHDRKVAIKVLKPELAAVLGAERFVQEIKTTAALTHPHILPLFDSGEADGFLYYVMPYLKGETVREKLSREQQLGIDEAIRIVTEVADALDYAHRHGVIHRDIKPENILLHDGRPMVMDFGIALAVSAAAGGRMTETGLSLGTPHYMSPEQATADREITGRSDIYSLGSVLYEMLSGEPPHMGTSAQQIIMKIIAEPVRPVTTLRKNVPANVADALSMALEKLPADRFATPREFAAALADPRFTATSPSTRRQEPRRGIHWSQVGAGILAGAIIGAVGWRALSRQPASAYTLDRQQLTFEGVATRPALTPDGERVAFVRETCEHAYTLCRASLLVQDVGGTRSTPILQNALFIGVPHWSADGRTLGGVARLDSARQGLFAIPLLSGTPQLIGPWGPNDTHPRADSVVVVTQRSADSSTVRILDLRTGAVTDSILLPVGRVSSVSWSPDGRRFALVSEGPGRLTVVDRRGNITGSWQGILRPLARWDPAGRSVLAFRMGTAREDELARVRVKADGSFEPQTEVVLPRVPTVYSGEFDIARGTGALAIVTGEATSDIHSLDLASNPASSRRLTHGTTYYGAPTVTHDGLGIYLIQGDVMGDNLYHFDLSTGVGEALTAGRLPAMGNPRLSADGRRLVYTHLSDSGTQVSVMDLPSRRVRTIVERSISGTVEPIGESRLFTGSSGMSALSMADSLGAPWQPVALPDSLSAANYGGLAIGPDGLRAVGVASSRDRLRVVLVPLNGPGVRTLAVLPADEPWPGLSWTGDTVVMARWLQADAAPSLWRIIPPAVGITRVATFPVPCTPASVSLARSGRIAACNVEDRRSDIWLYRVPGVAQ